MSKYLYLFFVSLLSFYASSLVAGNVSNYQLSSGDVISITVFAEPDLSIEEVRLDDRGAFSYPFIGKIIAQGLTASQLQDKITQSLLGYYLVNPKVSVRIIEYRPFFITGEVRDPGSYPYQPGLTIRRAIALAGGLTERASINRMTIIREASSSQVPERVEMKDLVMPGDSVTIGQGWF